MHNASVGGRFPLSLFGAKCRHLLLGFGKKVRTRTVDKIRPISVATTLALFASAAAFGQTAEITGRIVDPSGSVVPGAEVTVSSTATGVDRVVKTNSSGYYTVPLL